MCAGSASGVDDVEARVASKTLKSFRRLSCLHCIVRRQEIKERRKEGREHRKERKEGRKEGRVEERKEKRN